MTSSSKAIPTSDLESDVLGAALSRERTNDSSISGTGSKLHQPRMSARVGSTHSLLGTSSGSLESHRNTQTVADTNRASMDRASISMPPPSSKPAADRRLSASLTSSVWASQSRRSEDLARSPPSSVKSFEDGQLPRSPSMSTTATDTTSVTTTSNIPMMHGTPMLIPPPVLPDTIEGSSLVAAHNLTVTTEPPKDSAASALFAPSKSENKNDGALPSRPRKPRSGSSSRRISTTGSRTDDGASDVAAMGKIGVCALDIKARSRPSRQILTRLQGNGEFEVIVFGDKVILDEAVENWPICDFLISFFSDGFPLDKAIAYAKMRKPFLVNDLMMQKILWDRRLCLSILDQLKVRTPARLEVNRDGGPRLESSELAQHLKAMSGVTLPGAEDGTGGGLPLTQDAHMADDDTLVVDGKSFKKPFVEKPVSGEDHNVIIYFPHSQEGGARRLFRKIGNKSSEFDPDLTIPRCITEPGSSYIYETFLRVENAEDVKAYTVGENYCHAETRKSPVVDGLVRRNTHGKELRYVTKLNEEERRMAAKVARGFGQRICGFDLLRSGSNSYVIDVNGWSFVKDNEAYYNECARILKDTFFRIKFSAEVGIINSSPLDTPPDSSHRRDAPQFSHRQALKTILRSPSMSKLSQHMPHRGHHNSVSGTVSPKIGVPISSPPSMELTGDTIERGSTIGKKEELSPLPESGSTSSQKADDPAPPPTVSVETIAPQNAPPPSSRHSWKLKGVVTVIRHADRTPKQKIKFTAHSSVFVDLLKGHHEEVLLKGPAALASVENAVRIALQEKLEDPEKLRNLRNALVRKGGQPGTKVQIKPMFRKRKPEEMRPVSQGVPSEIPIPEHEAMPTVQSPVSEFPSGTASPTTADTTRIPTRSDSISDATFSRFSAVENDLVLDKLQLVMKWGGEPTHSARYQSQDLGNNMRDDYKLMNREVLNDVRIFTSSEKRVKTSAQIFAAAFLNRQDLPEDYISVRKDLLDDSNAAKDVMDKVKKKLKHLLREGNSVPEEFAWPKDVPEPFIVMQTVVDLLKFHRKVMRHNFKKLSGSAATSLAAIGGNEVKESEKQVNISSIQARWCTGEDAELFKERWEKLFSEFCDSDKADPSKISELYDTMKYDALHNKQFLEWVFTPSQTVLDEIARDEALLVNTSISVEKIEEPITGIERNNTEVSSANADKQSLAQKFGIRRRSVLAQPPSTPPLTDNEIDASYFKLFGGTGDSRSKQDKKLGRLRELYRYAKILFDYIGPQEYGISEEERLEIGLLTSLPLLREIVQDLEELQATGDAKSFLYFTKESHVYTLLNCIVEGGIHTKIKRAMIPELDYLSQICFELYEAHDAETEESTYSIRISISPGCHTIDPLDISLDSKHAIGTAPRRSLTNHQDWKEVISTFKAKFNTVQLPASFLAVNVSDKHEQEALEQQQEESKASEEGGKADQLEAVEISRQQSQETSDINQKIDNTPL